MWIVRLALRRPYTFVVMSLAILLLGATAIVTMPVDIFPYIDIPVVSIVWTYGGVPPEEMEKRIVTIFERAMTTSVNDIEHIESQSYYGVSVVRVYLHPNARVDLAMTQIEAMSNSDSTRDAAWNLSSQHSEVRRVQRSHSAVGSGKQDSQRAATLRYWPELHPDSAGHGARRGGALALWRQMATDPGGSRSGGDVCQTAFGHRCFERIESAESDSARRQREDRASASIRCR